MYSEEYSICFDANSITISLSISMQHYLGMYVEPIEDPLWSQPNRVHVITPLRLHELCAVASLKAEEFLLLAQDCLSLERLGATVTEATTMFARQKGCTFDSPSSTPYRSSEDLSYHFWALGLLHTFITEAQQLLQAHGE